VFELVLPFLLPAIVALAAWLLGFSEETIWLAAAFTLFFQFVPILVAQFIERIRQKTHLTPVGKPPCRCGASLRPTRRGKGYRCRQCNRRYEMASKDDVVQFVEKLDSGYTLAYMKMARRGEWEADIPACRCGGLLTIKDTADGVRAYVCSCHREYSEISEPGIGIQFREIVDSGRTLPYMKSIRWGRWGPDAGGEGTGS